LFNFPYGLCRVSESTLALTESDNHTVRILTIEGPRKVVREAKSENPFDGAQSMLVGVA